MTSRPDIERKTITLACLLLLLVGCSATCEVKILEVTRDKYVNTVVETPSGHRKRIGGDFGEVGDQYLITFSSFDAHMCDAREVPRGY